MRADVVLHSGRIWNPRRGAVSALAIGSGKIVALGSDSAVRDAVDRSCETVDLRGRTVVPGFQDAHVHPVDGGLRMLSCDLSQASSASGCLDAVAAYVAEHSDLEVVVGDGWLLEWFERGIPPAGALDAVVGNRVAFFTEAGGHSAWVSTAALNAAGIDSGTADPSDGRIERAPDGRPVGVLHDGAMEPVRRLLPETTRDGMRRALELGQEHLISLGITAWQDAIVTPKIGLAYIDLASKGALIGRASAALWWDRSAGVEQLGELVRRRSLLEEAGVRASTVKLMLDGGIEVGTAWMLEPYIGYLGGPSGSHSGEPFISAEQLSAALPAMERLGFQAHFHAIGDAAVRGALDAVALARSENGPSDRRHQIAHLQVVHPDDLGRFVALGVAANIQALWACHEPQMDDLTIPVLGEVRARWQYPFGALWRSGAHLAFGSDWPVSSASPLEQIAVAVSRSRALSGDGGVRTPFLGDQALSLDASIEAFTQGSARVHFIEDITGRIEQGMDADLAVLDADLFNLSGRALEDVKADMTWIRGRLVFDSEG